MKLIKKICISLFSFLALGMVMTSCSDSTSYADLLNIETKAINNYLADQKVIGEAPADSIFIIGSDAPYYRMDEDGNVYMRVISRGDMSNRPEEDDLVYLRFMRYNLKDYADKTLPDGDGNAENVAYAETIRYQNYNSSSSSTWGEGIQLPLTYFGYGCEVEIVMRSRVGRSDEISSVVPYLYKIRYFKSNI
jgi:hypothetical protein